MRKYLVKREGKFWGTTGGPGKSQGLKCTTMSHQITYLQQAQLPTSSLNGTYQFSQLLPTSRDEMLEDIKAIAELEPNGVVSHSCFYLFYTNCIIFVLRRRSLTRTSASFYKTPITGQLQRSIQFIFTRNFKLVFFLLLFCFARTSNDSFLIYAFENNCCS